MASRPELKVDDEVGFIRFYRNLPDQGDSSVRIFSRGDFYTAHGEDAIFIARTVYKTTSVLRQLGRNPGLESVTLSVTVYRNFLREALFRLGKRVEVWESSGRGNWKIAKQASPGNLQDIEDELGGQADSAPIILAVKVTAKASEARNVGVCFADASIRELGVCEFVDNDLYSNFESLLIQLGVKECLLQVDSSGKDAELAKLRAIADNCQCAVAERSSSDFGTKDIEQDLTRLLRDERSTSMLPQSEMRLAMGSAAALIKYLGLMSDMLNFGQYQLYQHDLSQYMKLDAAALKALNLMPGLRDGSKTMSLYGLLNHCKTPIGNRLLAQWLKQPLMDKEEIEKRQQLVEAFASDTDLRLLMQEENLRSIPDLYRLAKKFQRKAANLEDVVRTYQVAIRLPGFLGTLEGVIDEQYKGPLQKEYISKIQDCSDSLLKLQEMVETTVDLDALDNHEFIIKPDFDESLKTIRRRLDRLKSEMNAEHTRVGADLNQEKDKKLYLENQRVHGWCFRLTRNEAGCIRNKRQYQECSTQKNGVFFTTSTLLALRREFDQLSENYNRTQSGLVHEVVGVAASYCPVIERLAGVLAHLDVIVSFAHVSVHAPTQYIRPTIHPRGTGNTILTEARHPCMEVQDDVAFITNDITLRQGESEFAIITGPNMGGKSTYIRQAGVIALMGQVGCFVPCATAELRVYDSIVARVGAGDSQLKGVSTFMAEMLETANILKSATAESLIIIDELGRGTSTYDGFGLAWAIAEHIVLDIRATALFATHFHELTALANAHPQVCNLHVMAHIEGQDSGSDAVQGADGDDDHEDGNRTAQAKQQVTLLYRVRPGVCDQSFGIHVAEIVRFPAKVVAMAKRKAAELEDFSGERDPERNEASATASAGATTTNDHDGTNGTTEPHMSRADVEAGSQLLKQVLQRWKAEVEAKGLDREEQVRTMRKMVLAEKALVDSPFFRSVQAL